LYTDSPEGKCRTREIELKIGVSLGFVGTVVRTAEGTDLVRLKYAGLIRAFVARRVTCTVIYVTSGIEIGRGFIEIFDRCYHQRWTAGMEVRKGKPGQRHQRMPFLHLKTPSI